MSLATPATSVMPAASAACEELFALRRGVDCATLPEGGLQLAAWPHAAFLGRLTTGQHAVLRALAGRAHTCAELAAIAAVRGGDEERGDADHGGQSGSAGGAAGGAAELLGRLRAGGWLKITVARRGRPLYTLDPLRPPPPPPQPQPQDSLVLSRFAVLRRDDDGRVNDEGLVLESPRAWCDVRIHDPSLLAGLLGPLSGRPATPSTPGTPSIPGTPAAPATGEDPGFTTGDTARRLLHDLCWAGMAVPAGSEDGEFRLRQWGPHELWFHDRSRVGYRGFPGDGFAATFWAGGRFDPLPAQPEPFPGPAVALHRPDLDALRHTDMPLTAAVESRRSLRVHVQDDANPVTAGQLGEFLYRCARIRGVWTYEGMEVASRPYPSGGAVYELEVYPVVRHAAGLEPGMYHYDSHAHQLRLLRQPSHPAVRHLLRANMTGVRRSSQVLLVVSARPGRLMWKYEGMPYATMLKNLGAFYQTMYLVATAMGLAPCALGAGDAVAFAEATGRDPLEECSVGEFILGSRPPGPLPDRSRQQDHDLDAPAEPGGD